MLHIHQVRVQHVIRPYSLLISTVYRCYWFNKRKSLVPSRSLFKNIRYFYGTWYFRNLWLHQNIFHSVKYPPSFKKKIKPKTFCSLSLFPKYIYWNLNQKLSWYQLLLPSFSTLIYFSNNERMKIPLKYYIYIAHYC